MRDPFSPPSKGLKQGDPAKPFVKGRSGNPTGLAGVKHELARRIREQTDYGQLLIDYAKACVMGRTSIKGPPTAEHPDGEIIPIPDDPKSRAYCHAWLTERGWGRPKQELVLTEKTDEPVREDMRGKTLAELRQIAAGDDDVIDVEPVGGGDGDPPDPVH